MTTDRPLCLRDLPVTLRLAITAFALVVAGGYAASLAHLYHHYSNKDERAGLSAGDLKASFHGVRQTSALLDALQGAHGNQYCPDAKERGMLIAWLKGAKVSEDYDSIDLGDAAPSEVLARRCVSCHARNPEDPAAAGIGERVPLELWDDVAKIAFSRDFHPVPLAILTTSTHTHALTMPLVGVFCALLLALSGGPSLLVHSVVLVGSLGLLVDIGSWWLARWNEQWVYGILAGGTLFSTAVALEIALGLFFVWFGRRSDAGR